MKKIVIVFLLITVKLFSQEFRGYLQTDSSKYQIGETINLVIKVTHPSDVVLYFPTLLDSLQGVEFVKNDTLIQQLSNGSTYSEKHYQLMGFDSVSAVIGPFIFQGKRNNQPVNVITDSLVLQISTVSVDTSLAMKDIRPPVQIPLNWKTILLWVLAFLLLAVVCYLIYRYFKSRKRETHLTPDTRTPIEIARERLLKLQKSGLLKSGEYKIYYSELTELLREYFEKVYGLKALEETTEELISELRKREELSSVVKNVQVLLEQADLIKFAKFIPLEVKAEQDWNTTDQLLTELWKITSVSGAK